MKFGAWRDTSRLKAAKTLMGSKGLALSLTLLILTLGAFGCSKNKTSINARYPGDPNANTNLVSEEVKLDPTEITAQCLTKRIPVIMYHDIIEKRGRGSVWFDCTVDEFKEQMEIIQEAGYTPISIQLLYEHLTKGATLPYKPIVLTFDDNYQGFYDNALPILQELNFPSAVFVHTGFVGNKEGAHPKMSWDTLKEISRNPLVTIAGHTISHPILEGMSEEAQRKELFESKQVLESQLGLPCNFLAYPEGKYDSTTVELTREAGYKMAFTIANGPAELSPNIYLVNRYIHTRLKTALEECEQSLSAAPGVFTQDLTETPVEAITVEYGRARLLAVAGGTLETITSPTRESVSEFLERSPGAVAGINGTFFPLAAIAATDNRLMGPSLSPDRTGFYPDNDRTRWPRLKNRPLVLWNEKKIMIVPFVPEWMNDEERAMEILPGATNIFLAGAWLVHNGVPATEKDIRAFAAQDAMDPRRRAAFGILEDGRPFGACSKGSMSSKSFAEALVELGAKEAVLLDSGFSTSLVYDGKILASGHSSPTSPSRPVPHAILFKGTLSDSEESAEVAAKYELKQNTRSRR
jgi:biofilm PGA synthesis lipoprotein PgaB